MVGERLQQLMHRQAMLDQEAANGTSALKGDDVKWEEIWEAVLDDGIVTTDTSKSSEILLISPSRRGPGTASDIDTFINTNQTTGISRIYSPRIPHALTGQVFGYLINGLPNGQQTQLLDSVKVESLNGLMHLSDKGDSLLVVGQDEVSERVWTRESSQVQISNFRTIAENWLTITGARGTIIDRLTENLPNDCTLEEASVAITNQGLGLATTEAGHLLEIESTPPEIKPSGLRELPANSVETAVRSAILTATSIEQTGWYPHFANGIRKAMKNQEIMNEKSAFKIWDKATSRSPQAKSNLDFSIDMFLEGIANGLPQTDAFLQAVGNKASLGSILLKETTEAIRTAKPKGNDKFLYVPGKTMFANYLDSLASRPEMAVGFQPFDSRGDTGFMLQRLATIVEERGEPIPGIVMTSRDLARHDHSIFEALRDL